jgi:hypothetical protein
VVLISLTNHHDRELRVNITQVRIKKLNDPDFISIEDFQIIASAMVNKNFRIDLDPNETREYGVSISDSLTESYDYEIHVRDQTCGYEATLCGHRDGLDLPNNAKELDSNFSASFPVGMAVMVKSRQSVGQHYVISPEDGTPNDFGIFDRHQLNPTAAYIDLGRDGYQQLVGQHMTRLEWDRDTVASPPSDLMAIHIRNTSTNEHGWYFRSDLMTLEP